MTSKPATCSFGLGKRTVGDEWLATPVSHGPGVSAEIESAASEEPDASGLGLAQAASAARPGPARDSRPLDAASRGLLEAHQ